jgi:TPR repeat protein
VAGVVVLGFAVLVAVVARDVDSNLPTEHERKLAELEPREAERRRAESGNAGAQFDYAILLAQGGAGEPEDLVESVQWLEKAAVQGHAQAQFELALAYKLGRGTLQDYSAAARWFDTAARQQHVAAQYHMGRLHRIGEGVELDLMRAYAWFNRAASQGHGAARGARDEIAASLKPEQVVQAQQLSRDLQQVLSPGSAEAPIASTGTVTAPPEARADKP